MTTLNDRAAEQRARAAGRARAHRRHRASGCSGHVHELAAASGLAAEIDAAAVPAIDGVLALLEGEEALAGGSSATGATPSRSPPGPTAVPEPRRRLLCDAMTSGGLLAAVPGAMEGWVVGRLVRGRARARSPSR